MRSRAVSPPGAAARHLGTEGQRARGDQTGTEQLGACRRDRFPAVNLRQSVLREDERPHLVEAGHAAAMDGHRPGGRLPRRPRCRVGTQHPGRPVGWCIAQVFFNALLAALVAVLPDQVPVVQRVQVSGVLGVCVPIASVSGTFVVKLFTGNQLTMFLAPCAIGGFFILLFAVTLKDRRLAKADKPTWSLRELASTFYVNPRKSPDFAWAFASRFMFVLAYAFLITSRPTTCWIRSAAPRPMCRNRYSSAPSPSPSSSSPLPSSVAGSLTGRADGRSSSSQRRSCTAWRCS